MVEEEADDNEPSVSQSSRSHTTQATAVVWKLVKYRLAYCLCKKRVLLLLLSDEDGCDGKAD
eukprot:CAMPEP_0168753390 /NCGR_PEP_ID=MMETSP0724-20121128/18911_1 /TAXON_ID=265536 /ORGANISM="Amphiprora sp., Strain CCMP467" /LENGTH=61 /DNA_ID=CAMNT_0008801737 /DNA_START=25 /DNA_END=207 /DNA_ORIENTATION=-